MTNVFNVKKTMRINFKYFSLTNLTLMFSAGVNIFQPCLAKEASLMYSILLIPSHPSDLGVQTLFQAIVSMREYNLFNERI